jgi:hypothetical protein
MIQLVIEIKNDTNAMLVYDTQFSMPTILVLLSSFHKYLSFNWRTVAFQFFVISHFSFRAY